MEQEFIYEVELQDVAILKAVAFFVSGITQLF